MTPPFVIRGYGTLRCLPCELYQAWQAARDETDIALHAWFAAAYGEKPAAYAVYRAARDQEDAAAESFMQAEVTDE